ncbi:hypothetical protein MKK75_17935 [Methylobacterium sp. J-030]|uniref:hypothetical protein n=1 Tax=Methylobacterium sp. J-030 TaxID=2836627 RepID=UPI001FBB2E73|nr:hypothetical protein [Methylobacterium sp. J-030]MCJ2070648.1 hypothetical protein [Methylobacterium sp. J-030]
MSAINDPFEAAVLQRAQQNFLDRGPGNRMWADPSPVKGSLLNLCFTLNPAERAAFIALARVEIENETSQPTQAGAAKPRTIVEP